MRTLTGCTAGPVSLDLMFMEPLADGFVKATAVIQILFMLEITENDQVMLVGCSKFFTKELKLYAPDLGLLDGSLEGKAECLAASLINDFEASVIIAAHAVIGVQGPVQLLVPALGYCLQDNKEMKFKTECIQVEKFYDRCRLSLCQQTNCPLPHDVPLHGLHFPCPMPLARTRGFWGTGRGGIRRLIQQGVVDLRQYVENVLLPIVGPGGFSPFINSWYDPNLFLPEPNIQGIYDRTIELYESPIIGMTRIQLAIQLLTTWQNVVTTANQFLNPGIVCLSGDSSFAMAEIVDFNPLNCTFTIDETSFAPIQDILSDTEQILAQCCPALAGPCQLNMAHISALIGLLDMINNNHVFAMLP
ncbi:MAG: hypothetical protein FH749_09630 [Firmicutes bacterium]|nr:hypothetical protein [Bacillota bacterium]